MKHLSILLVIFCLNIATAQITFDNKIDQLPIKSIENLKEPILNSFAEAAKWADLVAIAQVSSIEYQQVRNINSQGYAFLNVLIPYKGSEKGEPIAVVASGFDDNACYYPDGEHEGERYLVFLKKAPEQESNVYYGFKPFCQMQILLSELGYYFLRTPLDTDHIQIDEKLIIEENFNDPHAMVDTTLWTNLKREEYAKNFKGKIIESEDTFNKIFHIRYTQGVPIYNVRPLLEIEYKARISSKQL
jgi:hypothetical protein